MARKQTQRAKRPSTLRERAESSLKVRPPDIARMSAGEIQKLVHELQVHQIELKMQNEELLASQSELAQSRDRFTDLYDFAPVGYATIDDEGKLVEANLTLATMLGMVRSQLVGKKLSRLVDKSSQDALYMHHQAVLVSSSKVTCRLLLKRLDGATLHARMESIVIRDALSGAVHWRCAIMDNTQRWQAEQAIQRSASAEHERRSELEALMDAIPAAVFIAHDASCRHLTGNRAALKMLRLAPGSNASASAPASERPAYEVWVGGRKLAPEELPMQRAAATGKAVIDDESEVVFPDGSRIYLLGSAIPLFDEAGAVRGGIGAFADISELKRIGKRLAEAQVKLYDHANALQRAVKTRTVELQATVAELEAEIETRHRLEQAVLRASEEEQQRIGRDLHDGLGQEIMGISMLTYVLQEQLQKKGLPEAETAKRLSSLLKHATEEVRRISHGLQPVKPSDPESLVTSIRRLVTNANYAHPVECVFQCDESFEIADHECANHIYRIIQEAMQNALRHGEPEEVTVSLRTVESGLILEVLDDGKGFPAGSSASEGIGLTTMKYRAEAMKGKLEFLKPKGGGTLVRCSIPKP